MCSREWFAWEYVTKLCDNRIFNALLRIKKTFKSINFDLVKHVLVSPLTQPWNKWVNFDWSRNYTIINIYLYMDSKRNL